jgi:hypothetical protein
MTLSFHKITPVKNAKDMSYTRLKGLTAGKLNF